MKERSMAMIIMVLLGLPLMLSGCLGRAIEVVVDDIGMVDLPMLEPKQKPRMVPASEPKPRLVSASGPIPSEVVKERGRFAAPGIPLIPLREILLPNSEIAKAYAIMEPLNSTSTRTPGGTRHGDRVQYIACHSHITACDVSDKQFQFNLSRRSPTPWDPIVPNTVRIVSRSTGLGGFFQRDWGGARLPYAVIGSAGNDSRDTFLPKNRTYNREEGRTYDENGNLLTYSFWNNVFAAAIRGDVLYVSGWIKNSDGSYSRHPLATGCEGLEDACIYAQFRFKMADGKWGYGTSFSAPHVASALASVLAIFPETDGRQLIRLAKACAVEEPNLPGLGRADFHCMTVMDNDGQWRVVTTEEFGAIVAPAAMRSLVFPGDAVARSSFVGASGKEVVLGTRLTGVFGFPGRMPADLKAIQESFQERHRSECRTFQPLSSDLCETGGSKAGFFPVVAGDEETGTVGGGYISNDGFFALFGLSSREDFFGLGKAFGYDRGTSLDVEIGHRNFLVRTSQQWASGYLINEVEGNSLGVTTTWDFELSSRVTATIAAHIDKFIGGRAKTAFGIVEIQESPLSKTAELALTYDFAESSSAALHWTRQLGKNDRVGFALTHRF